MTTWKALTLFAAVFFISGCGANDNKHATQQHQPGSMKAGIEQTKKVEEQVAASSAQTQNAAEVAGEEVAADTEASAAPTESAEAQASKVESANEPTPERTSIHTIVMQNNYGQVAFNHAAHTQFLSCSTCHPTEPPTRIEKNRKEFHALCRTCHHEAGAGPVKCSSCHEH